MKINLVVSELPGFEAFAAGDHPAHLHAGEFGFCRSVEALERAWDEARARRARRRALPRRARVPRCTTPRLIDDGNPGHVVTLFTQYGPPAEEGWPDGAREAYADRCLEILREYAPNMTADVVLHREILAPPDLERIFGLVGRQRSSTASRASTRWPSCARRPRCAATRRRSPGSTCAARARIPAAGVTGLPGRNAARRILADAPLAERLRRRATSARRG